MRIFTNTLLHLTGTAISLIIGGAISMSIFDSLILRSIFCGVLSILIYFLFAFFYYTIKAIKDPNIQAASDLRMSITKFKKYQRLFDEYQEYMKTHGIYSRESEEKFKEIFKQIDNPNEWRRYSKYREELERKQRYEEIIKHVSHMHKVGDKIELPMEDGGTVNGYIKSIRDNYCEVLFPFAVSIVPKEEPVGGWKDNAFPSKVLMLSEKEIQGINDGKYEGTERHYHF